MKAELPLTCSVCSVHACGLQLATHCAARGLGLFPLLTIAQNLPSAAQVYVMKHWRDLKNGAPEPHWIATTTLNYW